MSTVPGRGPSDEPTVPALSRSIAHVDVVFLVAAALASSVLWWELRRTPGRAAVVLAGTVTLARGILRVARHSGTTTEELALPLPGDAVIPCPSYVMDRGVTVRAPADAIWPWIVQMGYQRGGWYTSPWLDRLLWCIDNVSRAGVIPQLPDVRVGDIILDGPQELPGSWLRGWSPVERSSTTILRRRTLRALGSPGRLSWSHEVRRRPGCR
jgi:hypothetical protein